MPLPRYRLEHLGLFSSRRPGRALLLVLVLSAVAAFGFTRLGVDADLRNVFRSNQSEFTTFERAAKLFPAADQDVLLLVTGAKVATRSGIDTLRRLQQELALSDGVADVTSMVNVRRLGADPETSARLFPKRMPTGLAFRRLMDAAAAHPMIRDKLLSDDRRAALMVVKLDGSYPDLEKLRPVIAGVRKIVGDADRSAGLTYRLTGIPVMRILVTDATIRDQIVFNFVGALLGLAICFLFFRNWRLTVIALVPSAVAVLWALGGMGLAGQKITYLTNVVPILVMIIAFCDAMHLTFDIQTRLRDGDTVMGAVRSAVREVGPACVLTTATTAIALLSLSFAGSNYVAEFGTASGIAILTAFFSVILIVPMLGRWLLRDPAAPASAPRESSKIAAPARQLSRMAAFTVLRAPRPIALVGGLLFLVAGFLYFQNEPRYQYREALPRDNPAYRAIDRIDRDLGGANEIQILIEWAAPRNLGTAMAGIRAAHLALASDTRIKGVWSADLFVRPIDRDGLATPEEVRRRLGELPQDLGRRVIARDGKAALVMGYVADRYSGQMDQLFSTIDRRLAPVRKAYPDMKIALTGFPVVSARLSGGLMDDLRIGLLIAVVLIVILIGIGFRSTRLALISLPVNLFPLAAAGAFLFATDAGLQFSSVLALTVAFGIAVDDTIHFLNAYRRRRAKLNDGAQAIAATILAVGPVLIATTAILAGGLGLVLLSELPTVQLFGTLVILVLIVALIADMLLLPALLLLSDRRRRKTKGNVE